MLPRFSNILLKAGPISCLPLSPVSGKLSLVPPSALLFLSSPSVYSPPSAVGSPKTRLLRRLRLFSLFFARIPLPTSTPPLLRPLKSAIFSLPTGIPGSPSPATHTPELAFRFPLHPNSGPLLLPPLPTLQGLQPAVQLPNSGRDSREQSKKNQSNLGRKQKLGREEVEKSGEDPGGGGASPVPPSLGNAPAFSTRPPFTWLLKGPAPAGGYLRQRGGGGQQLRYDCSGRTGRGENPDHDPPQAAAATAANFAARCPPRRRLGKVPRLRAGGVGGLSRGLRGGGGWGAGGRRLCGSWGLSQEGGAAVRGLHSQLRPRTAVPAAGERGFAFAGSAAGPGPLRPGAHALG